MFVNLIRFPIHGAESFRDRCALNETPVIHWNAGLAERYEFPVQKSHWFIGRNLSHVLVTIVLLEVLDSIMTAELRSEQPAVVIKVGGSLFTLPDFPERLSKLLDALEHQHRLLVVGGGKAADVVREWDAVHHLTEQESHILAVRSMSLTAQFVARLLSAPVVYSMGEAVQSWTSANGPITQILDVASDVLLRDGLEELPKSWDVTSDAIAAWLARSVRTADLLFVKSVDWNSGHDWTAAVESGHIDGHTPVEIARFNDAQRIGWANLRSDNPSVEWLR